jgi:hypothetical protein
MDQSEYFEILKKIYKQRLGECNSQSLPIGKHNDIPDDKFDPEQLKKGQDEEKEHSDNSEIAKSIAKDHLFSDENYYKKLKKYVENRGD